MLFYSSLICLYHLNYFNIYSFLSFLILWLSWYLGSLVLLLEITFISVTICESESHSVVSNSLRPHGLYSPWNSPGQNTGVGSLSLLQGIFPTQGLNQHLLHCRQILYHMSHQGSPKYLLNNALCKIYFKNIYKNELNKVLHLQRGKWKNEKGISL